MRPEADMPETKHAPTELRQLRIDHYNAELRDAEGFIGDRASKRAFLSVFEDLRDRLRELEADPLGDTPTARIGNDKLDAILRGGDTDAVGVVLSAIEAFAQELAGVIRRFLHLPEWQDTQRIVIGGGLRASRVGEVAIGRASALLKAEGQTVELRPIAHNPDAAGLIGAVHLAPPGLLDPYDAILAVDVGGTKIRTGCVTVPHAPAPDADSGEVRTASIWVHAQDHPTRDQAVERIADMLLGQIAVAKGDRLRLAPFIGIGCPGLIRADGTIERGGQNLPGDWEQGGFNLPSRIRYLIPRVGQHDTVIVMHNDAVVQGLSQTQRMRDVERWGILTVGTGLGNARFSNPFDAI